MCFCLDWLFNFNINECQKPKIECQKFGCNKSLPFKNCMNIEKPKSACRCKMCAHYANGQKQIGNIYQPAFSPLICPKNFDNYSPDFWENGFGY